MTYIPEYESAETFEEERELRNMKRSNPWVPTTNSLPTEGNRVEFIVEFDNVKLIGGGMLAKHTATFNGTYHNVLGWYKKAGREEAHVAEKIQSGKVIKWRYL